MKLAESAARPSERPSWVPVESSAWTAAVKSCGLGDEDEYPKTYHLPPPNLFYTANAEKSGTMARLHNWLRIRPWCIQQVLHPAAHGMVLMSAMEWRVALQGDYYQVRFEAADDDDPVVVAQRAAEMARLPENPRIDQQNPSVPARAGPSGAPAAKKVKLDNAKVRSQRNALVARGVINIRFGLYASFAPYRERDVVGWRQRKYTLELATQGTEVLQLKDAVDVWAEVVWEVTVLSFRLEFLQLDRHFCSTHYEGQDGGFERSQRITAIWSDDRMIDPDLLSKENLDRLSSPHLAVKTAALQAMAGILCAWPGGEVVEPLIAQWQPLQGEVTLFSFYIRSAHRVFNRLPIVPLTPPLSMLVDH